jgi:MOSC domain-containing protein YiiM
MRLSTRYDSSGHSHSVEVVEGTMLEEILTSPASKEPMTSHESIEVIANVGLAGDRYATGKGFYSGVSEWDAHVTLIQQEVFDWLAAEHGVELHPRELRRNLVTRGVNLYTLLGREFRIGEQVVLRARKLWPPCAHIVKFSGRIEIFKYLGKHCGIGADVLVGGTIHVGDAVVAGERVPGPD